MGNIYARQTKLTTKSGGIKGRVSYVSDPERQEKILAFSSVLSEKGWKQLATECRAAFEQKGSHGKCTEGREFVIGLPDKKGVEMDYEKLAVLIKDDFYQKYKVPCAVAIHSKNEDKNIHMHLIFSERELMSEPEVKIAERNLFFNENGKRVYKKSEILDENGEVRKGCEIIKKGEVWEQRYFTNKKVEFKGKAFTHQIKEYYAKAFFKDVFDRSSFKIAQIKYGKGNPKEEEIKEYNNLVKFYNDLTEDFPEIFERSGEIRKGQILKSSLEDKENKLSNILVEDYYLEEPEIFAIKKGGYKKNIMASRDELIQKLKVRKLLSDDEFFVDDDFSRRIDEILPWRTVTFEEIKEWFEQTSDEEKFMLLLEFEFPQVKNNPELQSELYEIYLDEPYSQFFNEELCEIFEYKIEKMQCWEKELEDTTNLAENKNLSWKTISFDEGKEWFRQTSYKEKFKLLLEFEYPQVKNNQELQNELYEIYLENPDKRFFRKNMCFWFEEEIREKQPKKQKQICKDKKNEMDFELE